MYKVLHITPHMGGGVGNVISGLASNQKSQASHKIILLEQPLNTQFVEKAEKNGLPVLVKPDKKELDTALRGCDILIVHWWHHPKITQFLFDLSNIPVRIILWTHISSLTVPALNPEFVSKATRVLFTAQSSYEAETFSSLDRDILKQKTGVVPGTAGLDYFPNPKHKKHDGFNIGYLGLIDFSKMHPEFVSFCKAVNIPDARFILAGDAPAKDVINRQVKAAEITNPFVYCGYVTDIPGILAEFDVLGYPLMSYHTCTTENVILEAMAAEVPPVLINQLVEKDIIEDNKTGILVSSIEEYGRAMRYLYENPVKRQELGRNAREYVMNRYQSKIILDEFQRNCELAMEEPKRIMDFKNILGNTPAEWFMSCLGKDKALFENSFNAGAQRQTSLIKESILTCSPILKGRNKSSILHYEREFPNDPMLRVWGNMIREMSEET